MSAEDEAERLEGQELEREELEGQELEGQELEELEELEDEEDDGPRPGRRVFLGAFLSAAMAGAAAAFGGRSRAQAGTPLRPPGALEGEAFDEACVRCFRCGSACPNGCIKFHPLSEGLGAAFTPYIQARDRGCILCGECTRACPTGALRPFEVSREGWRASVSMGKARLNREMCYSYHGRTCGACYQACPLAGEAMTLGIFETPILHHEACVGCGLCEQACLHLPQAIRVIPIGRQGGAS